MDNTKVKMIFTRAGLFGAGEVMAVAILYLALNGKIEVTRTWDSDVITNAIKDQDAILVSVGGIYNPTNMLFDCHQFGGAGKRQNDTPFGTAGLIWNHFGTMITGVDKVVWNAVDETIAKIDTVELGGNAFSPISKVITLLNSAWVDKGDLSENEAFNSAVTIAVEFLKCYINENKE